MAQSLCSTCRSIDFRKYSYENRFRSITLGSWRKVSNRQWCRFCRLVRDALIADGPWLYSDSIIKLSNRKSWKCCTSYNEYHGVRQSDYSNEFDLEAYATKTNTLSRYQFVLYWKAYPGSFSQVHILPILPGSFFGRTVDRHHADLDLCRSWLDLCDKYHSGTMEQCAGKKTSRRFLQECLRLIDTKDMIIVKGTTSQTEYVALTYVWGEDKLKQMKPPGWEMPCTLQAAVCVDEHGVETIRLPSELPHTIRDAMEVTRSLGYRYIWVDSLCIVQDDKQDKELQLGMMDEIYSNASLTVAAGSGLHADWGLPGISRRRRHAQRTEMINGVELAIPHPSFEKLNSGTSLVWNTRGWTLQEKLLSKRLLLFTDFQVYFRCANSICSEDIAMEAGALSKTIKRRQNPFAWGATNLEAPALLDQVGDILTFQNWKLTDKNWKLSFLPNYVALVSEYTQRTFSFSEDKLKAISGVLRTLDPSERAFPGTLPRAWLTESLLWQPRDYSTYSFDTKTLGIPSWSWAAWSLGEGCVWSQYAAPGAKAKDEPSTTIHVQENDGSVSSKCLWRTFESTFGSKKTVEFADPLSNNAQQLVKSSGTLLSFRTSICNFRIGKSLEDDISSDDTLQTYYLIDNLGFHIGKIWTCDRVALARGNHQFIALSSRNCGAAINNAVAEKYIPTESDGDSGSRKVSAGRWRVVNVMLVEWDGDVAFRVAVGQVISRAWNHSRRKLVYLG